MKIAYTEVEYTGKTLFFQDGGAILSAMNGFLLTEMKHGESPVFFAMEQDCRHWRNFPDAIISPGRGRLSDRLVSKVASAVPSQIHSGFKKA